MPIRHVDEALSPIIGDGPGSLERRCAATFAGGEAARVCRHMRLFLALQLHFSFEVSAPRVSGLVSSPPERPCENTVD